MSILFQRQEILEQPQAIARVTGYGGRFRLDGNVKLGGLDDNREQLVRIQNMMLAACGTSYFASMYGARLMRSYLLVLGLKGCCHLVLRLAGTWVASTL